MQDSNKKLVQTTLLFSLSHFINIASKIVINKVAAITLGAAGIGMVGILQSLLDLLKTFFSFGLPQSAVRDISVSSVSSAEKLVHTVSSFATIIILFASIGFIISLALSPFFNYLYFDDSAYIVFFAIISFCLFMLIVSDGYMSILRGVRASIILTKSTAIIACLATVSAVILYFSYGFSAIPYVFIINSLITFFVYRYFVLDLNLNFTVMNFKNAFKENKSMIFMGLGMMYVSVMLVLNDFVIKLYLNDAADLTTVGFYQVGVTIVGGYFGIVISSLAADYYPRISSVHDNNSAIEFEMNRQTVLGLIIVCPLIVTFMAFSQTFIQLLYSADLLKANDYISVAIFGIIFQIVSNSVGYVILAKQLTKVFVLVVTVVRFLGFLFSFILFSKYGILGLGLAFFVTNLINFIIVYYYVSMRCRIKLSDNTFYILLYATFVVTVSTVVLFFTDGFSKKFIFSCLILASYTLMHFQMKQFLGIDFLKLIRIKIGYNK